MKITIITACYNAIATIRDAIESVKSQKLPPGVELEHLIIDGGSSDGTVELLKEYDLGVGHRCRCRKEDFVVEVEVAAEKLVSRAERPIGKRGDSRAKRVPSRSRTKEENRLCSPSPFTFTYLSEKDRGMYDAINKGIKMASGEVIGILNADDILASDDVIARIAGEFSRVEVERCRESVDMPAAQEGFGGDNSRVEMEKCRKEGSGETSPDKKDSLCSLCSTRLNNLSTSTPLHGKNTIDCVYGKVYFVKPSQLQTSNSKLQTLRQAPPVRRCFAQLWRPWMLQWGYMPPHPGIFIRKSCFEKWGGYVPDRAEYRIAADYELLIRFFRVHHMRSRYAKFYTTIMRTGGVSTRDVNARKLLNKEIIKANRTNGFFCCWPMLLPKYLIKVWEVILPRLGVM